MLSVSEQSMPVTGLAHSRPLQKIQVDPSFLFIQLKNSFQSRIILN